MPPANGDYKTALNLAILRMFRKALRISLQPPRLAVFFLKMLYEQKRFLAVRSRLSTDSLAIPPLLINSITKQCNLNCKGCYAFIHQASIGHELSVRQVRKLFEQAAGRGFVHIQADGALEPCPFSPYSDVSLQTATLKEALHSVFLASLRNNHHLLTESGAAALSGKAESWSKTCCTDLRAILYSSKLWELWQD